MNSADIADKVATSAGITKAQAKSIVDSVFSEIAAAAKSGDEVSIPGFGKFKVQDKPARTGRNPATGATIQIAASKKVSFTAAKALKDSIG